MMRPSYSAAAALISQIIVCAWSCHGFVTVSGPKAVPNWQTHRMAFKTDQTTNMFDGPAPLVKERDACGVGFIANVHSGGKGCF
jgi:hypothetical protein